jgi:predicted acylesterase/phospholipase RssA
VPWEFLVCFLDLIYLCFELVYFDGVCSFCACVGENENLRRAIRGRPVAKQGLRILSMDGGGMKGLATVQILKEIEKGTGKRIHEMFDLICGTSTGGMLAVALGIKLMSLEECEEIYKNLGGYATHGNSIHELIIYQSNYLSHSELMVIVGKLVFAEPVPKDNEAETWREKFDQLYKSSSQSFRVVVHGSKVWIILISIVLYFLCIHST